MSTAESVGGIKHFYLHLCQRGNAGRGTIGIVFGNSVCHIKATFLSGAEMQELEY